MDITHKLKKKINVTVANYSQYVWKFVLYSRRIFRVFFSLPRPLFYHGFFQYAVRFSVCSAHCAYVTTMLQHKEGKRRIKKAFVDIDVVLVISTGNLFGSFDLYIISLCVSAKRCNWVNGKNATRRNRKNEIWKKHRYICKMDFSLRWRNEYWHRHCG